MRKLTVDTTETKACKKCGAMPTYRHHKGNDGFLGIYSKKILGEYHQWLDCVDLCLDCHCEVHFVYQPYLDNWINRTPGGAIQMRKFFIGVCDKWLVGKIKKPKIPKEFRDQFVRSLEQWKKAMTGSSVTGSKGT